MVDVSKFTLDTPIKISIMTPGIWLPELDTYTPVKSYASIDKVVSMMNRGIAVDFPQQSEEQEISKKIEDILLEYQEKKNQIKKEKHLEVGTNIDKALDVIQDINDSHISPAEAKKDEEERNIFDSSDINERINRNLAGSTLERVFNGDDFMTPEDRIVNAEKQRISKEHNAKVRAELLKEEKEKAEIFKRLAQDAQYTEDSFMSTVDGVELVDISDKLAAKYTNKK